MGTRLPLFGWVINLIVAVPERIMIGPGRSCRSGQALNTSVLTETSMPGPIIPKPLPSVEYLRQCLSYNPDTGELNWLSRPEHHFSTRRGCSVFNSQHAGKPAGNLTPVGYISVFLLRANYPSHRLAWKLFYGEDPKLVIDHINGVKHDNRIVNLRDVSRATNGLCCVKSVSNKSGVTGIGWSKAAGKWLAQICFTGENHYLGIFSDLADAVAARKAAEQALGFSASHGQDNPCKISSGGGGSPAVNNRSGVTGVHKVRWNLVGGGTRWGARIVVGRKQIKLGYFDTKEEAVAARKAAEIRYGVADRIISGSGPAILQGPPT